MMQLMYCTYKRENTPSWKQLRVKLTPSKPHLYSKKGVAERLALPTSDHGVAGSNPAGGEILPEPKRRFFAKSFSCSPSHRLEMTEILLKGRKTLLHPSNSKKGV